MTGLPSGTVTLLFTDVEESTRLLEELGPERYMRALSEGRRLVRATFASHGGVEVEMQGDSFHFAFGHARGAVLAAAEVQRALSAHAWEEQPLRVRIGIHTGEPAAHEGLYAGLDVHRAARVMAAGHGGQILLSETTRALVEGALGAGLALRDLGEHRLKDLTLPQRLYQLEVDGLPAEFPPLRTLENRPTNLPAQPNALIGRGRELQEVAALVLRDGVRLVTLTGPGGAGKTRLALQSAADLLEEFPDGVFFVALASIREPDLVLPTIAQTLGARERPGESLEDALGRSLGDRGLLLLLDNFEQVVAAAPRIAELLQRSPATKLLVTSREPLHIRTERVFPVPTLELPDPRSLPRRVDALSQYEAVALFIERARAVQPEFEVTTENAPAVAEICIRLDGLPLAIELAAARIALLPPDELLARLGHRFTLLTGGPRDLDERQQTLQRAIEWSYDLLDERERQVFARLGVFLGGFTLDAAELIAQAELDTLQSLVDKSLVRAEAGRFSMLESIREYSSERLEATGEADEVRRRHADWYLALVERLEPTLAGTRAPELLDVLESEYGNIRLALAYVSASGDRRKLLAGCAALTMVWRIRHHIGEGLYWLEAALAGDPVHSLAWARCQAAYGSLLGVTGESQLAWTAVKRSVEVWRTLDDHTGLGGAYGIAAFQAMNLGRFDDARAAFEEGLVVARAADDELSVGNLLGNYAEHAVREGDLSRAAELFDECAHLASRQGDLEMLAMARSNMGLIAERRGDHRLAARSFEQALPLLVQLGWQEGLVYTLIGTAALAGDCQLDLRAAELLGMVEEGRERLELALQPTEEEVLARTVEIVRSRMGVADFDRALAAGRARGLEDALELSQATLEGVAALSCRSGGVRFG